VKQGKKQKEIELGLGIFEPPECKFGKTCKEEMGQMWGQKTGSKEVEKSYTAKPGQGPTSQKPNRKPAATVLEFTV